MIAARAWLLQAGIAHPNAILATGGSYGIRWFDAGHGSNAIEQQIEHQALKLEFAYSVLGDFQ